MDAATRISAANPDRTRAGAWIGRRFTLLLLFVATLCGAVQALGARHGGFGTDDVTNLGEARERGLTLGFLTDPIIGERLSPGHRLLDWMVLQLGPHEWAAALVLTGLWLATSVVLGGILVRQISGSATIALVAALLLGTWVGWVRVSLWWAASAHLLPGTALSFAALLAALWWDRTRRAIGLWASGILLLAAFMFSLRAAIVPPLAAVLLVLGRPPERTISWRGARARLRAAAPVLIVLVAVSIAYTVVDVLAGDAGRPLERSGSTWLSFGWLWLVNGVGPIALNGSPPIAGRPEAVGIVGSLVLVALAAATIRGWRSGLVWASTIPIFLFCAAQVGVSRLSQLGVGILVGDLRYHEGDAITLFVLVPCAWAAAGRPWPRTRPERTVCGVLAVGLACAWIVLGRDARRDVIAVDPGPVGRAYIANMRATLPAVDHGPVPASLVNLGPPAQFAATGVGGLDRLVRTFAPDAHVAFRALAGPPILLWDDGRAHPLRVAPETTLPVAGDGCLRATAGSSFLTPGSATAPPVALPPATAGQPLRLLILRYSRTHGTGLLGVTFRPSPLGVADVVFGVDASTTGNRVLVPATATGLSLVGWAGLDTCVRASIAPAAVAPS